MGGLFQGTEGGRRVWVEFLKSTLGFGKASTSLARVSDGSHSSSRGWATRFGSACSSFPLG